MKSPSKTFTNSPVRNVAYAIILIVSVTLIYFLVVREMRFFLVPSDSMLPTLHPRDYILTLNADSYERGDIIVLNDPESKGEYLVKRIVGVGGDTVSMDGGALTLNGLYASEPYLNEPIDYRMLEHSVPEGHVFVLGDNRNASRDSHLWVKKSVPVEEIIGQVKYIYLPTDRMGPIVGFPLRNLNEP